MSSRSVGKPQSAAASSSSSVGASEGRLSPSSWARATVPIYPFNSAAADFGASSRLLLGVPAAASASGLSSLAGRYSAPLSLRGWSLFARLCLLLNAGLWLVRDASLGSFALYTLLVNALLYFVVVRGEPASISLLVESEANRQARKQQQQQQQQGFVQPQLGAAQVAPQTQHAGGGSGPRASPASSSGSESAASPAASSASKPSPPAPVAFAFPKTATQAADASQQQPSSASVLSSPSPTGEPVFHEPDSVRGAGPRELSPQPSPSSASAASSSAAASPQAGASSALSLHTRTSSLGVDASNMPATPSVAPVITPMPQRPASSDDSSASSSGVGRISIPTEFTPVVVAGATSRYSSTDASMCFTRASGASYDVRIGPNYKKYGKKAPSKPAMYEAVGCDVFGAPDGKLDHVAAHLQLPWIAVGHADHNPDSDPLVSTAAAFEAPADDPNPPGVMDPVTRAEDSYAVDPRVLALDEELGVPTLFIVNFQIPTYAPGYFSSKEDGEGFSIVLYYQITAETRKMIRTGQLSGAVQLFKDFVNNAHEFEFHSRFKCIPRIVNPSSANVGMATRQAMKMYNSKPFLTGPHCHQFLRGPGYMEADIDVHRFCTAARKGAYGMLDVLSSLIVDIGFVVEGGRDGNDAELPEQILGCAHIAHLDPLHAKTLQYYIEVGKKERAKRFPK